MAGSWLVIAALLLQLDPGSLVSLYKQALAERARDFGSDHPKVARSASDLGLYLRNLGDREMAAAYLRQAFEINRKHLQAGSPLLAEDMENLASVAPAEDALALHLKAAECTDAIISARNWGKAGDLYAGKGEAGAALKAYRNALAREETASGASHPRIAVRLNDLAQVVDPKAAEPLLRRALAIEIKLLGARNPATGVTMNNLASALLGLGKLMEAEGLARRSLKIFESTLGERHPRVATVSSNLASILREKPDLSGSRRFFYQALAIDEAAYGANHPEVAVDLRNLAEVLQAMGKADEARRLMNRAEAIVKNR